MINGQLTFRVASKQDEKTIFSWLSEPHMMEFWDNSQAHKDDISNFIHGREQHYFNGTTQYYIGLVDHVPFALLLADLINATDDSLKVSKDVLSKFGHTIAVDFGIGEKAYIGRGLATKTLEAFLHFYQKTIDISADTFFIDPDEHNARAIHVYKKAGFKQVGKHKPTEGAFAGLTNLSMIKKTFLKNDVLRVELAKNIISKKFPEFSDLPVNPVEKQGHDNRTFRLGTDMLIRMPTAESYAINVSLEHALLPKLAKHLSVPIPEPIKMGSSVGDYPCQI